MYNYNIYKLVKYSRSGNVSPKKNQLSVFAGNKIKELRQQNDITQEELAHKLNITKAAVSNYETGYRQPKQDILFDLTKIFNTTIDAFFPERVTDKKNEPFEYPEFFLPEHAALAQRFVREKRPLGSTGINFNAMSDEQAIAYANLIAEADKHVDEEAELHIFRTTLKKKQYK